MDETRPYPHPPTINLPVKGDMGGQCRGTERGPLVSQDVKEAEANLIALAALVHHRLMMLNELQDDILARIDGHPKPPVSNGNPTDVPELSLIRRLEQCEILTHSLICTTNEISCRMG